MKFTADRPIGDQLLESILEHPEDWDTGKDLEKPSIHRHKNGVEIWAYGLADGVKIWAPTEAKGIVVFTAEEKQLLFKAIESRRTELRDQRFRKATQLVLDKMNYVEPSPSTAIAWLTKDDGPNDLPGASWAGRIFFFTITIMAAAILWAITT
jgi:hypothetical protein